MNLRPDMTKVFEVNGKKLFIFHEGGEQIDPNSPEGQTILGIYARQTADRKANEAQREAFIKTTHPTDKEAQDKLREKIGKKPK